MSEYRAGYRAGYVEGKVKVGVYIDPEIQKTLKIRAAQTGESMSEIAERALRRELGMMALTWRVVLGFDTYDDLLKASRPIIREGAANWYVTPLPTGQWAAWDDSEVALDRCAIFDTCEEAVRFHVADYLDGTADWEEDVDPGWDGSGTIAQSWTTSVVVDGEEFTVRIDRFKESEGGGVAYSVIRDGDYLPGGENMDAASRSDAEAQAATLIARATGVVRSTRHCSSPGT